MLPNGLALVALLLAASTNAASIKKRQCGKRDSPNRLFTRCDAPGGSSCQCDAGSDPCGVFGTWYFTNDCTSSVTNAGYCGAALPGLAKQAIAAPAYSFKYSGGQPCSDSCDTPDFGLYLWGASGETVGLGPVIIGQEGECIASNGPAIVSISTSG